MHDLLDRLAAGPAVIAEVVGRVDDPTARPSPGEWSVVEIIGHIRAADAIWTPRILVALVHDGAPMPGVDERALQTLLDGAELGLDAEVALLAARRAQLVGVLRSVDDAAWQQTCVHTVHGSMTVIELCTAFADHESEHLAQLGAAHG